METNSLFFTLNQTIDIREDIPKNPTMIVILSSGYSIIGFDEPIQVALGEWLSKKGIGWIQYTFPARNRNNTEKELYLSGGILSLMQLYDYAKDKYKTSIGLFGISFGGNISIEVALAKKIESLILVNPVFDYVDFRRKQLGDGKFDLWNKNRSIVLNYQSGNLPLSFHFIEECEKQDLERRAEGINCPVYAFQGEKDSIINPCHINKLSNIKDNWNAYTVPNADHGFTDIEAITYVLDRLDEDWVR